jgi:hypothetical protein
LEGGLWPCYEGRSAAIDVAVWEPILSETLSVLQAPTWLPQPDRRDTWTMPLQHPVPEQLLARIGDITVSFALLESTVQTLAASQLQESQRIGQIITAELSFRNLRALVTSLYRERHGEDAEFETLQELMKRAARLGEKRNQITHSIWGAGEGRDTVTRIKATAKEKRGIHFDFQHVSAEDLDAVAKEIKTLAEDVQRFWIDLIEGGKAINDSSQRLW